MADQVPIKLEVRIEPDLPVITPNAVSFETGATRVQAADPTLFVYEHHGENFCQADPGALTSFFEDLILGRPFPFVFATRGIQDVDTLMALALFLHRDLAVHPKTPGLVATVDFVHRRGLVALAHIETDLARFLCFLRAYFPDKGLSKRELGDRLATAVMWIREFIHEERLPHMGVPPVAVRLIDQGTNGFVAAETKGSLIDGWVELFRQGFLRGLLVGPDNNGRRKVLAARKSHYVQLDLVTAARLLNQMEGAMGELPEWESDGFFLKGPSDGTLILVSHLLEVLIRV